MEQHVLKLAHGRQLTWREYGAASGWPVIVLAGTPGVATALAQLQLAAQDAGVRLIAVARAGYRGSSRTPRRLEELAADYLQLADHLGLAEFSVLGQSNGGVHAQVLAQLAGPRVRRVAIVSGMAPPTPQLTRSMHGLNRSMFWLVKRSFPLTVTAGAVVMGLAKVWPGFFLRYAARTLPAVDQAVLARPEIAATQRQLAAELGPQSGWAMANDYRLIARAQLRGIAQPVILWYGEQDRNVPAAHAAYYQRICQIAQLQLLPYEGHTIIFTQADAILYSLLPAKEVVRAA